MLRTVLLTPTLVLCACAGDAQCRPWMPSSAGAPLRAAAPLVASTSAPTAAPVDDGTRLVEAQDHALALLGETAPPASKGPAAPAAPAEVKKPELQPKPAVKKADPSPKPAVAKTENAPKISEAALAEANKFYLGRCVPCHGTQGRGDGPAGAALNPHPRNFTDRAWQGTVTDAHIEKTILQGGPSVGKSPLMPPHADLNGKPELLAAMRKVIRGFGR
ncbi:MAG: hypothetical protein U1E65_01715 [Myxococcota bacterium]